MPVHFKGSSEYDRHYVWRDSFRSKSFKPSKEQATKAAGSHSAFINNPQSRIDPPRNKTMPAATQSSAGQSPQKLEFSPILQAKKRVEPPFLSKSMTMNEPVMQSKKRVVPAFAKTALIESVPCEKPEKTMNTEPVKSVFDASVPTEAPVPIQSKKRVVREENDKPIQSEPPLQSKRRTQGPPTTLSAGFYDRGNGFRDDFALLGNQDKFSQNVKYRVRGSQSAHRDSSPPKQMKLVKPGKENQFYKTAPAPAPVVNVDQFKQPPTPLAPRRPKQQTDIAPQPQKPKESYNEPVFQKQPKVMRSPKQDPAAGDVRQSKAKIEESEGVASRPLANEKQTAKADTSQSKQKSQPANEKAPASHEVGESKQKSEKTKPITRPVPSHVEALKEIKANKLNLEEVKNLDRDEPVKSSVKNKQIMNMNEFTQTNMEKGVADSAPEAPADYALKYKTGIAPPRPARKFTEYQKQFAWRNGMPASPLLKAEQVVYNSNPQLSPPKKDIIPKVSEYQKQFKAPKYIPVPKEDMDTPRKIAKLQRSKSMEDMSPADIPTAGSAPVIAPDNRRLTLETNQPQRQEPIPEVPKKKSRNQYSEYKSNFKPPTKFDYLRGSWHGANPPHIQMQVPSDSASVPALSNWFSEVLELRRKAGEYRQRALGTHFSREHMLQLMAKQTDFWDASTTSARSVVSALSLESGLSSQRDIRPQEVSEDRRRSTKAGSTMATLASEDDHARSERLSDSDDSPPQKKLAWGDDDECPETPSTITEVLSGEGRMTTPKFREKLESGSARRHHLDRTTPAVGGALLSSPPSIRKKKSGKRMVSKSCDNISLGTMDDSEPDQPVVHRPLAGQKTYNKDVGYLASAPTFGMPSRDSHFLRDDDAGADKELLTQFVHNPAKGRGLVNQGGLDAIDEGFGQTYNKSKASKHELAWTIDGGLPEPRLDDDQLSVSMQSIASSCSVASETLDRARKRKEEFWGKNGIVGK